MTKSHLQCIKCGQKKPLIGEREFKCPNCGELYDVVHDLMPHQGKASKLLRKFDRRKMAPGIESVLNLSGIWRFKELIMPDIPENDIVSLGEGNVPIVPAGNNLRQWLDYDTYGIDVYLILLGVNPTNAFKPMGMTTAVSLGNHENVQGWICSSTGDTVAALAAYCTAIGVPCTSLLPKGNVTQAQILQSCMLGAKIIMVPGDFDDCLKITEEMIANHGYYPGNSLNPSRIEGHKATVFLAMQHFDWQAPDWFVVPVGNGSNASSIGKALRELNEIGVEAKSRILGCQTEAARPLYNAWLATGGQDVSPHEWIKYYEPMTVGKTIATASRIGHPKSWRKVIREITSSKGAMTLAKESLLKEAVVVTARDGHLVCPQSGQALAGLKQAIADGTVKPKSRVVVTCTADWIKFTDSFMNVSEVLDAREATVQAVLDLVKT